jgi:hypothetical protein
LEQALPEALRLAAQSTRELRRTLPRDYLEYMGVTHEGGWVAGWLSVPDALPACCVLQAAAAAAAAAAAEYVVRCLGLNGR